MADRQKNSQVIGQVEWDQSDPKQKSSQVIGQVEWFPDPADSKQLTSQIVGQVEYVDVNDLPIASSVLIIT